MLDPASESFLAIIRQMAIAIAEKDTVIAELKRRLVEYRAAGSDGVHLKNDSAVEPADSVRS